MHEGCGLTLWVRWQTAAASAVRSPLGAISFTYACVHIRVREGAQWIDQSRCSATCKFPGDFLSFFLRSLVYRKPADYDWVETRYDVTGLARRDTRTQGTRSEWSNKALGRCSPKEVHTLWCILYSALGTLWCISLPSRFVPRVINFLLHEIPLFVVVRGDSLDLFIC